MRQQNLSEYGPDFVSKLLKAFFSDHMFYKRMHDILKPEYFTHKVLAWLVSEIQSHYEKFKKIPSLADINLIIKDLGNPDMEDLAITLVAKIKATGGSNLELVKDKALTFCQFRAMSSAVINSAELLDGTGTIEDIKEKIDKLIKNAQNAGKEPDLGLDLFQDLEERMEKTNRKEIAIPTKWKALNKVFWGWCPGELYTFMAPWKRGKTWFLSHVGAAVSDLDKKVLHVTLELSKNQIGRRYDTIFSGISSIEIDMDKRGAKDKLRRIYAEKNEKMQNKNSIRIVEYPTNGATVNTIRGLIETAISLDFNPDILIVDYADLFHQPSFSSNNNKYYVLGDIFGDLRGLAGYYNIPVITATQTNRDFEETDIDNLDIIDTRIVAESSKKNMISDLLITWNRDRSRRMGLLFIANSRVSSDGYTFPVNLDTERGIFDIVDIPLDMANVRYAKEYFRSTRGEESNYDSGGTNQAVMRRFFDGKQ